MMNTKSEREPIAPSGLSENLTAIHIAAQLMCRQSEGRQTYPVAKSIVMLTEQALETLKKCDTKYD